MAEQDRTRLHELRRQGHEAGIEGSSKMTEEELKEALRAREQGADPQQAKSQAKE